LTTVGRSEPPIKLNDLIKRVQDRTRSCTELERLAMAVEYGELIKVMGDDLVGHFVEHARGAGASWAQVGEQLGVTKQAAHQRHVSRRLSFHFGREFKSGGRGPFERFTQEAREVIVTAQEEARSLLHNYLGVEHLLLGLSADRVVGPLLGAVGASTNAILDQVRQIVGEGRDTPAGTIPFTPRAKRALEVAARAAGRSGEQIEPAHILLGVLDLREGVGAQILDELEVSRDDLRRKAKAVPPSQD
jgi:ClpA/ClpB-like protein